MASAPSSSAEIPTQRIDGRAVAEAVVAAVGAASARLTAETGIRPGLAVVLVGEDPASQVYVGAKGKRATALGFHSVQHTLPASTSEIELIALVEALNRDPEIHGILVQFPLPGRLDEARARVIEAIAPEKDVDGLHPLNVGRLAAGGEAMVPCTPAGAMLLIRRVLGPDLSGREAVVVGRSNLVGKPIAQLLLQAQATVTIAHSRTADLPAVTRRADILVAATGRPEMVRGDWIKPGAVVIDVGINRVAAPEKGPDGTRLCGDVATAEATGRAAAITPVPGGVGPMTIAMLMANTVKAAYRAAGWPAPPLGE
ncbi:bifunctional methylenetetrahydrofolate dehydrogenase/methenyltetrahydrofolate cyclohydrolase FolD [Prosthecomicrobium pneumaticum]|uniref:Bifunctional protein FolD n=1 Tax=Prosthecomicrobium pneumaticum TaxID=81895 RepID=A0A7W9FPC4_9HYPH|nr:bifunctional methylenetetrahydrofolate dehydrogenase/methenyltetrahydrofolate cyclohydrolase FolD [Prosthecomicrobium pneumaticum]MBB5754364.1 methylenetetrahydrofolate dehydrogenase (NADP+)/methenyltetrahydrofolate cyclohydrolase [Prosthecomicrobium pneumaticum]